MTDKLARHTYAGLEAMNRADEPTMRRLFEGIARRGEITTAASYAGLSAATVHRWRNASPEFDDAICRAMAGHGGVLIDKVWSVMDDPDLRPGEKLSQLRWFLERLHPASFGDRSHVTVEQAEPQTPEATLDALVAHYRDPDPLTAEALRRTGWQRIEAEANDG
jgi:hypothetical protein